MMSTVQSEVKQPVVVKTMTIGEFACWLILNKPEFSNENVLAAVKEVFPDAKTSMASIAWYKSDLRKKGLIGARSGSARAVNQDAMAKYMAMAAGGTKAASEEHSSEPETPEVKAETTEQSAAPEAPVAETVQAEAQTEAVSAATEQSATRHGNKRGR